MRMNTGVPAAPPVSRRAHHPLGLKGRGAVMTCARSAQYRYPDSPGSSWTAHVFAQSDFLRGDVRRSKDRPEPIRGTHTVTFGACCSHCASPRLHVPTVLTREKQVRPCALASSPRPTAPPPTAAPPRALCQGGRAGRMRGSPPDARLGRRARSPSPRGAAARQMARRRQPRRCQPRRRRWAAAA